MTEVRGFFFASYRHPTLIIKPYTHIRPLRIPAVAVATVRWLQHAYALCLSIATRHTDDRSSEATRKAEPYIYLCGASPKRCSCDCASAMEKNCLSDGKQLPSLRHNRQRIALTMKDMLNNCATRQSTTVRYAVKTDGRMLSAWAKAIG